MHILDCESPKSAIDSISKIFSCTSSEFSEFSNSLDLEKSFVNTGASEAVSFEGYVFNTFVDHFQLPAAFDEICWFHGSRTLQSSSFKKGLLPLNEVLPQIWDSLILKAPNEHVQNNLLILRKDGVPNKLYGLKVPDKTHWGPYGYLVKEFLTHTEELCQHNYLAMPEIIEDICSGYKEKFQESIVDIYTQLLKPCIVKFITPASDIYSDVTNIALCYAYFRSRNEPINSCEVACFNGHGHAIGSEKILSAEYQQV